MRIKDVIQQLEQWAPKAFQESYDNCGIQTGNANTELTGVLISLDVTEKVLDEAIQRQCNLIVSHHPLLFKGVKSITGKNDMERCLIKAIKHDITLYAIHTNLDHVSNGVNYKICQLLDLQDLRTLVPKTGLLSKLITYVPIEDKETVLTALFEAGAGEIGNYSSCAFRTDGVGSFKPNLLAHPVIGKANKLEQVAETKIETIFPTHLQSSILAALKKVHPYEEVAFDIFALQNDWDFIGAGMYGSLDKPMTINEFNAYLKQKMNLTTFKFTSSFQGKIEKVAVCGGSGSFLLKNALGVGAQAFVTADFKYHEFFDAEDKILVADIGHYESEVYTKDLIYDYLKEKFSNIAVLISEINTNPIHYYS
ncbi:MAG: Nif3-like dinuclear metal center hexameric protein [Chitinophagaceae bacterium]|nr:Nif3-like dinuclear metal center hexameric protein [Chitinophagaceae bacterium]